MWIFHGGGVCRAEVLVCSCPSSLALRELAERERCGRERKIVEGDIMAVDWDVGVECNSASLSEPTHTWQAQIGEVAHVTAHGFELRKSFSFFAFVSLRHVHNPVLRGPHLIGLPEKRARQLAKCCILIAAVGSIPACVFWEGEGIAFCVLDVKFSGSCIVLSSGVFFIAKSSNSIQHLSATSLIILPLCLWSCKDEKIIQIYVFAHPRVVCFPALLVSVLLSVLLENNYLFI